MIARFFGIALYVAMGFLILAFIFSNRMPVVLELFPLAHTAEMPLYIALCGVFALGLILGLLHSATVWVSMNRKLKRAQRAVSQLEKEKAVHAHL